MTDHDFTRADLLAYLRANRHATLASVREDGAASAALVGLAVAKSFELVFDTLASTRKHPNLVAEPRVSLVYAGPGEQTVQIDGIARLLDPERPADLALREVYLAAFPDGRARLEWKGIEHWVIRPLWARHVIYEAGEHISEFAWSPDGSEI